MPGPIVFQALLPDTFGSPQNAFWIGAFSTVIITGIYTVFGGMRAIMNTATPQAVIILVGSFVITAIGLDKLGAAGASWCAMCKPQRRHFALWRPPDPDPAFPLAGRADRLAHHRHLVLVHRPVHRPAARPLGEGSAPPPGAARSSAACSRCGRC